MSREVVEIVFNGRLYRSPYSFSFEETLSRINVLSLASNCCFSSVTFKESPVTRDFVVSCSYCLSIVDSFEKGSKKYFTESGISMMYPEDVSDERMTKWAQIWSGLSITVEMSGAV